MGKLAKCLTFQANILGWMKIGSVCDKYRKP